MNIKISHIHPYGFTWPGVILLALLMQANALTGQPLNNNGWWHNIERSLHYSPAGQGFKLAAGHWRFNRALYGTNTGFRVETGDLPEFALYLPGMGGNIRFGIIAGQQSKWLAEADSIETVFHPGIMRYTIRDAILGKGHITIEVMALASEEGMIVKLASLNVNPSVTLVLAYGGVTGKKFSRDGDIGADAESVFYLQPDYCKDNKVVINNNSFAIGYANDAKAVNGTMPLAAKLEVADASGIKNPLSCLASAGKAGSLPILVASMPLAETGELYFEWTTEARAQTEKDLTKQYAAAKYAAEQLAGRVKLHTPDPWLNTMGGALASAADAIWEAPSYLHGAVAWRMRLPAWRGANVADPLGWHDRARLHFSSYAKSQVTSPETAPVVMDTALNLARHQEKMGTAMFSSGYICRNPNGDLRPHHYDMNLVFIDQLLTHFEWTGDTAYVRTMWPVIKRHLAWEKRNFDTDGDGLYDAYCCIWASDALQYSGGGVTHSSAYNYRAFAQAARLAKLLGEDGTAYAIESQKIWNALQNTLWLKDKGWFAEYKDLLGRQLLHPAAGLWTVYHAMDAKLPNAFQAYQMMRYVDTEIPHIPVKAHGLPGTYHLLSTTNWMPYTWSINNVALGELMHTSLAYWQAGRSEQAFRLWKSTLVESMYLGASPGGFHQVSFYDAVRGLLYRDFADGLGMTARSLVEGLFGITPDALKDTLTIQPGFPAGWPYASLEVPDMSIHYKGTNTADTFTILPAFEKQMNLRLVLKAKGTALPVVTINGHAVKAAYVAGAVGEPVVEINTAKAPKYEIIIRWHGSSPEPPLAEQDIVADGVLSLNFKEATPLKIYDPQGVLKTSQINKKSLVGTLAAASGHKTVFVQLRQNDALWWTAVDIKILPVITFTDYREKSDSLLLGLNVKGLKGPLKLMLNRGRFESNSLSLVNAAFACSVPLTALVAGTNLVQVTDQTGAVQMVSFLYWQKKAETGSHETVDMAGAMNARVTDVFKQQYLSPRPVGPTLQLPTQGIGNWCYPLVTANINDSGFRAKAAAGGNRFVLPQGIPFKTTGNAGEENIAFVSMWDNYPQQLQVALSGKASHAYLLMAGTTNHMQSRLVNGMVKVEYSDGSFDSLLLENPENWWPVEQDYYEDGFAFSRRTPRPPRVYLYDGSVRTTPLPKYSGIKGFSSMAVEGGAATVLDLPLNMGKTLKQLTVQAIANDVVIGLMGVTLVRE